jgi:predicted permease
MQTAENIRRGMSDADARRSALLEFGGTQRYREETNDARGFVALDNLARDTRFALHRLRRAPAFSAGVIATLGIGIGVAVGIGAIVYDVLLRDLPYDRPDQLVRISVAMEDKSNTTDLLSAAVFFHFAKSAHSFTALGAYATADNFNVTDGDTPERVNVAMVLPSTLALLGVRPVLGHLFETRDSSWSDGSHRIPILISEDFWRRRYGADSSIIGRQIDINRGERIVVGILPHAFAFPSPGVDLYYPMPIPVRQPQLANGFYAVIGRLRDGITPAIAQAELTTLLPSITDRFPAITSEMVQRVHPRTSVTPLKAATVAQVQAQLTLLGILVAVVLLIATSNVVNLFLLRAERAGHEIAIALSLGATRLALAQRFIIEGVVLGVASVFVALPAAALALATKFGFTEREIPRLHEVSFTAQTIIAVIGCAIVLGAIVGLAALTRVEMTGVFDRLHTSRSTASRGWRRAQHGLVAFQVGVALMLLVAAGLLGRSFWNLRGATIGFDPRDAVTFQVSLPWSGYQTYAEQVAFHAKLSDRLAALPGVTSVGIALRVPLASHSAPFLGAQLQTEMGDVHAGVATTTNLASTDYFRTMGIPLHVGRGFRAGDFRGAPAVVLSERLATNLFGTRDVVGRLVMRRVSSTDSLIAYTVVGVAADVQWEKIEDGYVPTAYFPLLRDADGVPTDSTPLHIRPTEVQYAIRGTQLPTAATIQGILKELDRRVPAANVRTLQSLVDVATARVRLTMFLIVVTGAAALLLGVIGVYSVVAYAANGRMREFGIRIALGASPSQVGSMVFGDGLRLVTIGIIAGLIAALGTTRFLRGLLYEVQPTSVAEFAMATTLLLVVTLCATLLPARRAARTHPAVVLRGE